MIYTIGRMIEDFRTIAGDATAQWWGDKAKQTAEEALAVFLTSPWNFNQGEGVIVTRAPYNTGTVAAVNGNTTITLTGGTWSTGWTTPAVIRIDGSSGDSILISSFDSSTTATLDISGGWPFTSKPAATYTIEFPAHAIPSYMSVTGVSASRLSTMVEMTPSTMEAMLWKRPWVPSTYWPAEWCVIPSDGVTSQKIFVWPAPAQVQTLRYEYIKAVPPFRYYRTGVADATNGVTGVTGTGTLWNKLGYSLAGQYFEFLDQPGHQVAVASVGSDTALTLVAGGYTGQTEAGSPYCVSPSIVCPDDLKPLLRAICRWKYYQDIDPRRGEFEENRFKQLRDQALSRYEVMRDARPVQPIMFDAPDLGLPPPLPSVLRLE